MIIEHYFVDKIVDRNLPDHNSYYIYVISEELYFFMVDACRCFCDMPPEMDQALCFFEGD